MSKDWLDKLGHIEALSPITSLRKRETGIQISPRKPQRGSGEDHQALQGGVRPYMGGDPRIESSVAEPRSFGAHPSPDRDGRGPRQRRPSSFPAAVASSPAAIRVFAEISDETAVRLRERLRLRPRRRGLRPDAPAAPGAAPLPSAAPVKAVGAQAQSKATANSLTCSDFQRNPDGAWTPSHVITLRRQGLIVTLKPARSSAPNHDHRPASGRHARQAMLKHLSAMLATLLALATLAASPAAAGDARCLWSHLPADRTANVLTYDLDAISEVFSAAFSTEEFAAVGKACGITARTGAVADQALHAYALQLKTEQILASDAHFSPSRLDAAWNGLDAT